MSATPPARTPFLRGRLRSVLLIAALVAGAAYVASRMAPPRIHERRARALGPIMISVKLAAGDGMKVSAEEALDAAVDAAQRVNRLMNAHDPKSEIGRLNRLAAGESLTVSREMWEVLLEAKRYHVLSGGAFDPTVGPLVKAYGFKQMGKEKRTIDSLPSAEVLAPARACTGMQGALAFEEAERRVTVLRDGVEVDLGAIAKGYAVDLAVETLIGLGVRDALVEIGGEARAIGRHPENRPWTAGIRDPQEGAQGGAVAASLKLSPPAMAVATSGDYEQYFIYRGERYSHIIDPRSGKPVKGSLASVTVIAPDCTRADAIATTLSVLGEAEAGRFLAQFPDTRAILQLRNADGSFRTVKIPDPVPLQAPEAEG